MQLTEPHITCPSPPSVIAREPAGKAARIRAALGIAAQLVVDDPVYLPIFERLESELASVQAQTAAIERAHQFLTPSH